MNCENNDADLWYIKFCCDRIAPFEIKYSISKIH